MVEHELLTRVLDLLESEESKLLTWGDTGAIFSELELEGYIKQVSSTVDVDDVLEALLDKVMLYEVLDSDGRSLGYRSRMAESVHLYRNLRQWFPNKQITEASTLVSDFRFLRRPRQYPRRNLKLDSLYPKWEKSVHLGKDIKQAIQSQIGSYQLSGFQDRATERILQSFEKHQTRKTAPSATIISAGTGSGKTLAFYLPALSSIAAKVIKDPAPRVRVLAIYPRIELLKDQFNETWQQCRRLDELLLEGSGRKLRIGAFYGGTKDSINIALEGCREYLDYELIRCSKPKCPGQFRWLKQSMVEGLERLTCNSCGMTVSDDEVVLTRTSMIKAPPDIVFTTAEMLNQQIGNPRFHNLFGINTQHPIPLILLDEVHTYSGSQGAQTAFLLNRWMRMAWTRPHFVGLSATLTDAEMFFSRLTGVSRNRVRLVEPSEDEIVEEGAEYLIALRGDPVSQTALLSTTIQTAMLTRRILDRKENSVSDGIWGSRTFIFTDNLDVTNRLFSNLANAEGWKIYNGRLSLADTVPLASLRNPAITSNIKALKAFGQDWGIAKEIGHTLSVDDRGIVSRTSSQDAGVDVDAELVVASSSLEVGFNDPTIGAVIQHKAPRNMASYLQRKGRAGRSRRMRPWTIVVLSDFGRDRITYQHYEKLLDPEVTLQRLPTENSHIHRMQAAMAVLDWLSLKIGHNMWSLFNFPRNSNPKIIEKLLGVVSGCLSDQSIQRELEDYLSQALRISEENLNRVLWQPPRSIILEYLPLLKRRLETRWGKWDYTSNKVRDWVETNKSWRSPVPEFIPDNLFSDLNLPTLHIGLKRGDITIEEGMSFFQGLEEFSPGRVSKRFSVRSGTGSDWVIPDGYAPKAAEVIEHVSINIDEIFGQKSFVDTINHQNEKIDILQPHYISTNSLSDQNKWGLLPTSNARLVWHSLFNPVDTGEKHIPPNNNVWSKHLSFVRFHTHKALTQLELVRYSTGSRAEFRFRSGTKARVNFNWKQDNNSVGIGTRMWVDAVEFEFSINVDDLHDCISQANVSHALRSAYFQDRLRESNVFDGNTFIADWVWECFIASVAVHVVTENCSTKKAIDEVLSGGGTIPLIDIPKPLFQQHIIDDGSMDPQELADVQREQKLREDLQEKLSLDSVLKELKTCSTALTDETLSSSDFREWCQKVLGNTLAGALCNTLVTLIPDIDETSFIADPVIEENCIRVWLVEQESGGAGLIGLLEDQYINDPIGTLNTLSRSVEPYEYEQLDFDLHRLLRISSEKKEFSDVLKSLREAPDFSRRVAANKAVNFAMSSEGLVCTHSLKAVLHSRILRPGSNAQTDKELLDYIENWNKLEVQCGFEVPVNIVSLILAVKNFGISDLECLFVESCRISATLWPRGSAVRQNVLGFYNRFQGSNLRTERLIASCLTSKDIPVVLVNENNWLKEVHYKLESYGKTEVHVKIENISKLEKILVQLQTYPLDAMGLFFYPRISSILRREERIIIIVEFAEAIH